MPIHPDVLIVGSGHAGAQVAIALRQRGFPGTIGLTGEDPNPPYERPPLSKDYLSGTRPFERMLLRPPSFWTDRDIAVSAGMRAVRVDPDARAVVFDDATTMDYGTLVWATGGRARRLDCAGHDLVGVHSVRTRADVDRLLAELPEVRTVVIVGGGFIGMEAAAVLSKFGKAVTLLEAQDRLLARVCGNEIATFYAAEHRAHGIDIRTGASVTRLVATGNHVSAVELEDGETIAADMVIVGIGIVPSVGPLRDAGASCDAAAIVDGMGRTSLPDIYAIGDCATRASAYARIERMRIESVQNASVMAQATAADIMGVTPDAEPVPWFWSNQFDLKLQTAGINIGYDRTLVSGDPASRSFAVAYLDGEQLLAVDCVNAPKSFVQAKKILAEGGTIDPTQHGYRFPA